MMRSIFALKKGIGHRNKYQSTREKANKSDGSRSENEPRLRTSSSWDLLPVELQVKIFAQCSIWDLLPLKLVCRAFSHLLTVHEQGIAREYLRLRRHGTLPATVSNQRTYTRNPEDDVVLLSDLFPPGNSAKGGHLYTFRYLHSLRRRQELCGRLCYYLADRVMDRFMHTEQIHIRTIFPLKTDRILLFTRGVANLQFNLIPLMYCTLYFLETYAFARKEHLNNLLRDYEAGKLPVPIPLNIRSAMYGELQARILRSPPFTDTSTLIATHHCMHLLVSYLRHTMPPPDDWGSLDDRWIGALLTASGFRRIVEFFSAEIGDGGNHRVQRRDFMRNFHNDLMINEREEMNPLVYERPPDGQPYRQSIREVWFEVARQELQERNAIPHETENISVWNGIPVLVGCEDCHSAVGWRA